MQTERHELTVDAGALQEQLRHVYWIGGGSGAGKSTLAHRIAAERGLKIYATDDVMPDHLNRSTPDCCRFLHNFLARKMNEGWVNGSRKLCLRLSTGSG